MAYRVIEQLNDVGAILKSDGSELGERRYHLTVYQDMIDVGHGETIPGLRRIEGRIDLEGREGFTFVFENAELTLRLRDGRSLPFFFSNSDGRIAARGKFE